MATKKKKATKKTAAPAAPTETVVQRRRRLKAAARERQRETVPRLRKAARELKAARAKRRKFCTTQCQRRRKKVQAQAVRAREQLRARIAKLKQRAREACNACKVNAHDEDLDKLDRVLDQLATEREAIRELRAEARGLTSSRGRAGGKRAAELRAEARDAVRRDVADDPVLLALWEKHGTKIKAKPRSTLTETFLEWVHDHPEVIAELQAEQERQYAEEAEAMLATLQKPGRGADDEDLERWARELDQADRWLDKDAPKGMSAVPF